MTLPITGALLFGLGIIFFFFSPKLLYSATVVAVPFSATAIFNFKWAASGGGGEAGMAAWRYFCALWVFRELVSATPLWHRYGWVLTRRARYGLLAFLSAAVASLAVPLLENGTSWVSNPRIWSNELIPVQFGTSHLTQTAYLASGLCFAIFATAEICRPGRFIYTIRLYVASCLFAAAWGIFELWCLLTGHLYPAYIFNTNTNLSAQGYKEILFLGGVSRLGRITSVALEPSVFAQELLLAFVALLVCLGVHRPILTKKWDLFSLCLIGAALLASTSSTAYVGILCALVVAAITLSRARASVARYLAIAGIALTAGTLLFLVIPLANSIFTLLVLNKLGTLSGAGRLHSVLLAARVFLEHPILGLGWHSVDSFDLVFLILANTGLVGITAFFFFLLPVVRGLWKWAARKKPVAAIGLSVLALAVLLCEAAALTYSAGYFWLALAVGAGGLVVAQTDSTSPRSLNAQVGKWFGGQELAREGKLRGQLAE